MDDFLSNKMRRVFTRRSAKLLLGFVFPPSTAITSFPLEFIRDFGVWRDSAASSKKWRKAECQVLFYLDAR